MAWPGPSHIVLCHVSLAVQTQRSALSVTLSVWHALLLREALARLFHRRAAWLWLVLEPAFHIGIMVFVFTVIRVRSVGGIDTVLWLVLGFLGFFLFRRTASQCSNAITANRALFTYRQVKPVDTVFVRAIVEGLIMLGVSIVILLSASLLDHSVTPSRFLSMFEAAIALWLLGLGFGLMVSVAKELVGELGNIVDMLMTPLLLLSGVMIPLSSVPLPYREWLMYNPVAHGVEALRLSFADYYHAVPELSLPYLHGSVLISLFAGLALHVRYQQRIISK